MYMGKTAYSLSRHEQRCKHKQAMVGTREHGMSRNALITTPDQDAENYLLSPLNSMLFLVPPLLPGREYDPTSDPSALNDNRTLLQVIAVSLANLERKVGEACVNDLLSLLES